MIRKSLPAHETPYAFAYCNKSDDSSHTLPQVRPGSCAFRRNGCCREDKSRTSLAAATQVFSTAFERRRNSRRKGRRDHAVGSERGIVLSRAWWMSSGVVDGRLFDLERRVSFRAFRRGRELATQPYLQLMCDRSNACQRIDPSYIGDLR